MATLRVLCLFLLCILAIARLATSSEVSKTGTRVFVYRPATRLYWRSTRSKKYADVVARGRNCWNNRQHFLMEIYGGTAFSNTSVITLQAQRTGEFLMASSPDTISMVPTRTAPSPQRGSNAASYLFRVRDSVAGGGCRTLESIKYPGQITVADDQGRISLRSDQLNHEQVFSAYMETCFFIQDATTCAKLHKLHKENPTTEAPLPTQAETQLPIAGRYVVDDSDTDDTGDIDAIEDTDDTDDSEEWRIIELALGRAVARDTPTIKSEHTVLDNNPEQVDTDSAEHTPPENTPPVEVDTDGAPATTMPETDEAEERRILGLALSRLGRD
eukprot:scpid71506/ scgid23992/ 